MYIMSSDLKKGADSLNDPHLKVTSACKYCMSMYRSFPFSILTEAGTEWLDSSMHYWTSLHGHLKASAWSANVTLYTVYMYMGPDKSAFPVYIHCII